MSDAEALKNISRRLPPAWKPSCSNPVKRLYSIVSKGASERRGVRRFNLLYEDHVRIARSPSLDQVYESLESSLRLFVAEFAPRRVFIHAGVVACNGLAVVLPGRSFSGKTTLVRELVRAGATYYSDEYAVLDSLGRVHAFPKPLSIRDEGEFKQRDQSVEELGGRRGSKPLAVGLVVMSGYKTGSRWRPRQLSPGHGALELLANAVAARRSPDRVLAALQIVVSRAPVLKGVRGEAREAAESILEYLDRERLFVPLAANSGSLTGERRSA